MIALPPGEPGHTDRDLPGFVLEPFRTRFGEALEELIRRADFALLRAKRGGRDRILDVTRKSLESLGYWPIPEDTGIPASSELDDLGLAALAVTDHNTFAGIVRTHGAAKEMGLKFGLDGSVTDARASRL